MSFTTNYHKLHSGSFIKMGYANYICFGFSIDEYTNKLLCLSVPNENVTKEFLLEKMKSPLVQISLNFYAGIYVESVDYDFMDLSTWVLKYNLLHHTNYSEKIPYPIVKVKDIEKDHTYSDFTGCFNSDSFVFISYGKRRLMSYEMHYCKERWDDRYNGDNKNVCVFDDFVYKNVPAMNCPLLLIK